jgi:hypothetical protein
LLAPLPAQVSAAVTASKANETSQCVDMKSPSTMGGYPVVAVVFDEDTHELAETRPGDRIRFFLRRAPMP